MIIVALLLLFVVVKVQGENVLGRPEKPLLSPDRRDKVYMSYEWVSFTCTAPERQESISSFLLYNGVQRESGELMYSSGRYSATFRITELPVGSKSYSCSYTCNVKGTRIESDNSTIVQIQIVGRPEKPVLSPDRTDKVYVSEERITFTCTSPQHRESVSSCLLYKGRERASKQPRYTSGRYIATFTFREIGTGSKSYTFRPPKPQISSDRPDKVYVSDESIILTCRATGRVHSRGTFQLYNGGQLENEEFSQRNSATFTIANGGDVPRDYYCVYTCKVSGRSISSRQSNSLTITVVVRPPKPQIASDRPDKVYVSDESVILTCRATGRVHSRGTFQLYNGGQLENEEFSQRNSATFTIANGGDVPRDYYCVYTCKVSGRSISSRQSNSLTITVVVRPPKPQISSDRPDKVYVSDESVILTCRATGRVHSRGTFQLYNGGQLENEEFSQRNSATFTIANGGDVPRDYYCVYTCKVSGRSISSRQSNSLTITVVVRPPKPQISSDRPDKVYVSDESIILTCRATGRVHSRGTFQLYNGGQLENEEFSQRNSATFTIANGGDVPRDYYCVYTCKVSGRSISSRQSNSLTITVVVRPPKPQISSDRPDKVYVSDESVILTCRATGRVHSRGTFQLYNGGQLENEEFSQRNSATFTIANGGDVPRDYYCVYTCKVSGRSISSRQSNSLTITVVVRPPKPQISSDRPDKVYVSDESVILTCRATGRVHSRGTFQLYNGGQLENEEFSQRNSATFTIANGGDVPRDYYCVYTCKVSGRSISSRQSNSLTITVVDLPRPIISLVPSHVSEGEDVTFNCTSTKRTSVDTFNLYKNGVQLNDSVPQSADAQNKSATFTIQNVHPGNSGNYTCVYQLLAGDRNLTSAPSDAVFLSVRAKSIQTWIPALPVVALVLMFGVLGVYCWKKGKSRGRGEFRAASPPKDSPNSNDNVVWKSKGRAEFRAAPSREHGLNDNDNIVYADLKLTPRTKKQKGKKKCFETHADDSTVYADIKL
ncbi:carcinoembryonic antigen-related cell adhesion molecule 5-like [Hypanus sabinus]|uniref:carcinoembryonic antigen-related cell adhesion molecule 5-like n=1 Tax=Hypanus sabinus TaxID=79690 RepID=UPI0028C3BC6F|nr:carcinoembryonic antigen-related cell adhesion molecule 5-like [Hypanus sabinus]